MSDKIPGQIRLCEINPHNIPLNKDHHWRLLYHLHVVNEVRYHYGKPMICTSGLRTKTDQLSVYSEINDERREQGLSPLFPPMNSPHILGAASDWSDPEGELFRFLVNNVTLMDSLDIYVEDRNFTPLHCHIQTMPPLSGLRVFRPY